MIISGDIKGRIKGWDAKGKASKIKCVLEIKAKAEMAIKHLVMNN